jgi:hypothetical protein
MKLLLSIALAVALHAEDAPKPDDVKALLQEAHQQIASANQQIAQLQAQLQQAADAYQGCVVSRAQMQRPALNPQQQQMMQRPAPKEEK